MSALLGKLLQPDIQVLKALDKNYTLKHNGTKYKILSSGEELVLLQTNLV